MKTTIEPAGEATGRRSGSRHYWACWLAFYFGVPVLLALELGASESSSVDFVGKQYFFLYFLVACLPNWWAMDVCTRLVGWLGRPWRPPLFPVLLAGAIVSMNLSASWAPLRHALFEPYLAEGSSFYPVFPWRFHDPDYLLEAVVAWVVGGALWLAANYFFLLVLRFPRYGHQPPAPAASSTPDGNASEAGHAAAGATASQAGAPARDLLWDQVPEKLGRRIVALKAEEHYTRVFTEKGEALVLMRFRDAIALFDGLGGLQTHRSYWLNPAYVETVVREGRNSHARLTTGQQIPISRSYRVMALKALEGRPAPA